MFTVCLFSCYISNKTKFVSLGCISLHILACLVNMFAEIQQRALWTIVVKPGATQQQHLSPGHQARSVNSSLHLRTCRKVGRERSPHIPSSPGKEGRTPVRSRGFSLLRGHSVYVADLMPRSTGCMPSAPSAARDTGESMEAGLRARCEGVSGWASVCIRACVWRSFSNVCE